MATKTRAKAGVKRKTTPKKPVVQGVSKERMTRVLMRAAKDPNFRRVLLSSPDKVAGSVKLSQQEHELLAELKRVKLEEWGLDVRRFRAFLRDNGNKVSSLDVAILATQKKKSRTASLPKKARAKK